jgi:hypothetical protein
MSVKRGERTQRCAPAVIGAHLAAPVRTRRHLRGGNCKRVCIQLSFLCVRGAGPLTPSPRVPSGRLRPSSTGYGEGRDEGALPRV